MYDDHHVGGDESSSKDSYSAQSERDACSESPGDTVELGNFSSIGPLSLSRQEFYTPYIKPALVLMRKESEINDKFDRSNTLEQNFMGICYDEISNCIRDRYGFDINSDYYSIKDYLQFAQKYEQTTIEQTISWEKLLTPCYPDLPLPSLPVRDVIRKGIPASLRGKCWYYYSGAYYHYCNDPNRYSNLMSELSKCQRDDLDVIDKDVTRTFPDNVVFHRSDEKEESEISNKLRRVLIAFSLYRPEVGYCQGMNFIVGLSLLFMSEECSFWLLVTIVDHVMPLDIYTKELLGTSIDQDIFKLLLKLKYPKLHAHMESLDIPLALITCEWFMTLFVNALPIETALRVWDAFFYEGTKVLFRVSLALFHKNSKELEKAVDQEQLMTMIKRLPKRELDCESLLKVAFEQVGPLKMAAIDRKREAMRLKWFSKRSSPM